MKRASNSLLILLTYPFMALLRVPVSSSNGVGAAMRHTPNYITRLGKSAPCRAIFQMSRSLRSFNPIRLGEERIRGLFHGLIIVCLLASYGYAAGETRPLAVEEVSAIIYAEVKAMPEWNDADIRVEITGAVRSAPDESFRLAPTGRLTVLRNSVIAPIDVVRDRDGKVVRSLSVPAVVHASATAVVASRRIASGRMITEEDIRESRVETTNIGAALTRDPKEITGKTARRSFAVGDPLPPGAFSDSNAPLVRRGDMVNLRLERDGIVLTSSARAEENGRIGEVIRVKSVDFSSVIRARVTGASEVSIQ